MKVEGGGSKSMILEVNGMKYVQADRQAIFGNDPEAWKGQIESFIHNKIRHGQDVLIPTTSGEVIKITADTEGKSSFRNDVEEKGKIRKMTDEEYETKLNAEAHIDELVSISTRGKKNTPDYKGIHGDKASSGFNYRTAYFRDFDKKYYRLRISVMEGADGKIAYNIGEVKERNFPEKVNGSSAKSGAPGGEVSSYSKTQNADLVKSPNAKFVPRQQFQMLDSAGRDLTEGQQRYYSDSEIRDAQGRIQKYKSEPESKPERKRRGFGLERRSSGMSAR